MELNLKLTPDQVQLLNNILFDDCTYLENCTESEFNSYTVIRNKLTTTLHNHFTKLQKAQSKQPTMEW